MHPRIVFTAKANFPGAGYGVRTHSVAGELLVEAGIAGDFHDRLAALIKPTPAQLLAAPAAPASVAELLVYWAVALQQAAGLALFEPGKVLQSHAGADGTTMATIAVPYAPGRAAGALDAIRWLVGCLDSRQFDSPVALAASLADFVNSLRPFAPGGKNTIHFLRAAHGCGIAFDRVTADYYQFGWGAHSCLLQSSFTDRTPALGSALARRKHLGADVLRRAGLPAPEHAVAANADAAVQLAARLGYPVVVKPADMDGGVGVAAGLHNEAAVRRAFAEAARHSTQILVEKHCYGQDYRLLVFQGQLVWTVLRQPAGVTGNGADSVRQLVEAANDERRRSAAAGAEVKYLALDEEAGELLQEQALTVDSVPVERAFIRLRRAANVAMGGVAVAVNTDVHPDNRRLAEQAAAAFGLDLAGIDLIIPDIARSWYDTGAAICEVNAQPQFGTSTQQHLHALVLQALAPQQGRIPVLVVVGQSSQDTVDLLSGQLAGRYRHLGLASAHGAFVNGCRQGKAASLFAAVRALLFNKCVDAVIVQVSDESVLTTGLPCDRFDVMLLADALDAAARDVLSQVVHMLGPHCSGPVLVNASNAHCVRAARLTRQATLVGHQPDEAAPGERSTPALLAAAVAQCLTKPAPCAAE